MSSDNLNDKIGQATLVVNAGRSPNDHFGYVNTPVYRGSTILFPTARALRERDAPYIYGSIGGPSQEALEVAIAALEGGYKTRLVSTGLAAVTLVLLAYLKSGDHILVADSVYRPTRMLCRNLLVRIGVETTYFDPRISTEIADLIRPNTTMVFTESPGSQTFEIMDMPAISAAAHAQGALVVFDNTWASPLYFDPFAHGVDVSIQAGTKYISGHSDVMLGSVTTTKDCWPRLNETYKETGMCIGPDEAFLALRGMRTIKVRLEHQMQSGIAMARWFEARPEVAYVLHPALESHPDHALWKRDFTGAAALFAVVLKEVEEHCVDAFLDTLKLFGMGFSWGGFESLVIPFDPQEYRTATAWDAPGPALRFHIGLEAIEDLQNDLEKGFAALRDTKI
ncbi:MAG: cystathionine beta-lyase [Alphaproteobacteria bacterium]